MVQTSKNKIRTDDLGITLMHEHVFNRYPIGYQNKNTEFVLNELEKLKAFGVKTIVDLTPYSEIGRFTEVIEQCDLNIICSVGFYLNRYVPSDLRRNNVNQLISKLGHKIEMGMSKKIYKPGIIKIAAANSILNDDEIKYFSVASELAKIYQLPIATHSPKGTYEHYEFLLRNGVLPDKIYLSHGEFNINQTNFYHEIAKLDSIVKSGGYLLFSKFGTTINGQRFKNSLSVIKYFKDNCLLDKILISSDSNWKWKNGVAKFQNGSICSYDYLFNFVIPALIKNGFTYKDIELMLNDNPKKLFT